MPINSKGHRLLILEDERPIRELLCSEYTELGFDVLSADSFAGAREIISQNHETIDVSIFNLRLSDGDGLAFLKELRDGGFRNPVIFLTGNGNKHTVLEAFKAGAYDFLEKPFSISGDLTPVVTRALESVMLQRENQNLTEQILHNSKLAALGELSATVLHDIRGPLSMIQCVCDDFEEEIQMETAVAAELQLKHLAQIRKACARIQKLGNHLRNYSRQDAKEMPESREVITLIEESLFLVQQKIRQGKIRSTVVYDESVRNITISCFPNKLEQAIMNLCSNACDAMKECATKDLKVEIRYDKAWICILVSDTGIGMSPETQDKLFENFFTTKPAGEGTGLGLKIVRTIIQEHEGVLELWSEVGKGTVFTIKIPSARVSQRAA